MSDDEDAVNADIERLLAIHHKRRDLGWSYFGIVQGSGGGRQLGPRPMTVAERARRFRERKAERQATP